MIGTRPEAIKMAPVVSALRSYEPDVEVRVAHTGQHDALVDQVLDIFDLGPDYDAAIMKHDQSLYDVIHGAIDGLRGVVEDFGPRVVLVEGDTATVFSAALVGFFERLKVGHVEAGLRTWDKRQPFPEELFRQLTDTIADYHFAPTQQARENLEREGVPRAGINVTGNTVVDAVHLAAERTHTIDDPALRRVVEDPARRLVLLTAHRRESFGQPLAEIFRGVRALADRVGDIEVIFPVHPNPTVVRQAEELLSGHERIHLTEPLGYLDIVSAIRHASLVLTDSGGIQEEAPTFGAPVLVLRNSTERPEGLVEGIQEVVWPNAERILDRGLKLLTATTREPRPNPYGDGRAGERIADIVVSDLTGRPRRTEDLTG